MSSPKSDDPPSLPDEPMWLTRLFKDDEFEKQYNTNLAVRLVPLNLREILWSFSKDLIGDQRGKGGVTGQACRIFERYCAATVRKYENLTFSEWEVKKRELKQRASLLIAVSLMLASKIDSIQTCLSGSSLMRAFQKCGINYTLLEINVAEWDVFIAIGFRVPLWSNVQKAQMLVVELGLPECIMLASGIVMDLVELQLPLVYGRLKIHGIESISSATSQSASGPLENPRERERDFHLSSTHLMAGVVLASIRFITSSGPDVTPIVAHWSRTSVCYLRCLGNVIFQFLVETIAERMRQRNQETVRTRRSEDDACKYQAKRCRPN